MYNTKWLSNKILWRYDRIWPNRLRINLNPIIGRFCHSEWNKDIYVQQCDLWLFIVLNIDILYKLAPYLPRNMMFDRCWQQSWFRKWRAPTETDVRKRNAWWDITHNVSVTFSERYTQRDITTTIKDNVSITFPERYTQSELQQLTHNVSVTFSERYTQRDITTTITHNVSVTFPELYT